MELAVGVYVHKDDTGIAPVSFKYAAERGILDVN